VSKFAVVLIVALAAGVSSDRSATAQTSSTTTSPVAYVYVSRPTHIDGFAASSGGKLTPVPGSPFANTNVARMSVTKKFLFGVSGDKEHITSYSISSQGSLKKVADTTESPFLRQCDYPVLQVDFTGTDLYYFEGTLGCSYNPPDLTGSYISYRIETDGALQFLGNSGGGTNQVDGITQGNTAYLKMAGTNAYAFDSYCAEDNFNLSVIDIYKRESSGAISYIGQSNEVPSPGVDGKKFCAGMLATDAANHLAVAMQRIDAQEGDNGLLDGPYFLASYAVDSSGRLTTTSTAENMPEAAYIGTFAPTALSIDPTDSLVAFGGSNGFAIFHFNGSKPITKYSGTLLSGTPITQFGWDKSHHLYVLANGNLHVFTVTSTSIKQTGSPISIPEASSLIVLDE
jgi:hypothetical protein